MSDSTDHRKARTRCSRMGSVTGCGRRQLIETNEYLKNRRLVDVRGVMVLGVAGITEPVEITLDQLDLSTIVRAARDSKAEKIRDVSQLTTGLSGCGRSNGREFNHEVAFPLNRKEAAEAARRSGPGSRADQSPITGMKWNRCRPRSGQTMKRCGINTITP